MTTRSSPDLTAMRSGLVAWLFALLSIDPTVSPGACRWEDEPQQIVPGFNGTLRVLSDIGLGREEQQSEFIAPPEPPPPAGSELRRMVGGPRVMTLEIQLDGYDQRIPFGPFFALRSASTKIRGQDSLDALAALGLAVVETLAVQNVPRIENGRTYPRAVLDVRIGYTAVEQVSPTTYVSEVQVTSHVKGEDGVELPSPPNRTVVTEVQYP